MIGPPFLKMWTKLVFCTSALSAPPREGSSGSVPSPLSTRAAMPACSVPSKGRTSGLAEPDCGMSEAGHARRPCR